jgi:UDP-N-acetylglucosamine--N-acetylmuramyl-(pentapeptide) pyrophosphoryl-undecaprenol N-acetylglucosamine transferase
MKVVLTGGHLSPALSLIEELKSDEIFFIGRKYSFEGDKALSLEYELITKLGIPFIPLTTGRLQRRLSKHTFISLLKSPVGFTQSLSTLVKIKPDIVMGFGGYVSLPVIFAASFLGIPVVIHEQTLEAGLANKIASKFAKKICTSWKEDGKFFPKNKTILTGNPIRKELYKPVEDNFNLKNNLPTIYVTGGSSGSHIINKTIFGCVEKLLEFANVFHQTGDAKEFNDFDKALELKSKIVDIKGEYIVKKFLNTQELSEVLNKADLVISRSGANTVSELIFFKKPCILIPLPFSQKNEQLKNAQFAKGLNLAEIIHQDNLSPEILFDKIKKMTDDISKYQLNEQIDINIFRNASGNIVKVLRDLVDEKNNKKKSK